MQDSTKELLSALQAKMGVEVMYVKGAFCANTQPNCTWISIAQARKMTGIPAPARNYRGEIGSYGDWATVAAINHLRG